MTVFRKKKSHLRIEFGCLVDVWRPKDCQIYEWWCCIHVLNNDPVAIDPAPPTILAQLRLIVAEMVFGRRSCSTCTTTGTPHFDPHEPFIPFLKRIISLASDSMNCRFQPNFEIVERLKVQKGLSEALALLQL
jgi:hypothetical protein